MTVCRDKAAGPGEGTPTRQARQAVLRGVLFALLLLSGCQTSGGWLGGTACNESFVPPSPEEPSRGMSAHPLSPTATACAAPRWSASASSPASIASSPVEPLRDAPLVPPEAVEAVLPPAEQTAAPTAAATDLLEQRLHALEQRCNERARALDELHSHSQRQAEELTQVRTLLDASRSEVQSLTGLVAEQQQRELESLEEISQSLDAWLEPPEAAPADEVTEQD